MMRVTGEEARKLFTVPADSVHDSRLAWSPDGHRIAFASVNRSGDQYSIQSYDLSTGQVNMVLTDSKAGDFCLTQDGRIVYSRLEDPPNEKSANLWAAAIDWQTGRLHRAPRRLTNWPGSLFSSLGSSADGTRLFFIRLHYLNSVYVGELSDGGTRLRNARRFSSEQWTNWPTGWTRDSQAVFFNSDSNGRPDIYRQPMDGREAVHLTNGNGLRRDARLSPDGKWLLYFSWTSEQRGTVPRQGLLMRARSEGGPSQAIFPVNGYSGRAPNRASDQRLRGREPVVPLSFRFWCSMRVDGRHRWPDSIHCV
jgi:Tol biopolymer transport system component